MKKSFVFMNKWNEDPATSYERWLNMILSQYPDAEIHHSMAICVTADGDETWTQICAVAIVTDNTDFQQG